MEIKLEGTQKILSKLCQKGCEDKTSLKYFYNNQLAESDSIKHNNLAGVDNDNKQKLQDGQDD